MAGPDWSALRLTVALKFEAPASEGCQSQSCRAAGDRGTRVGSDGVRTRMRRRGGAWSFCGREEWRSSGTCSPELSPCLPVCFTHTRYSPFCVMGKVNLRSAALGSGRLLVGRGLQQLAYVLASCLWFARPRHMNLRASEHCAGS